MALKMGTYSATLPAGSWARVMNALDVLKAEYIRQGFPGLAEDVQMTIDWLKPQVTEGG